MSRDDVTYGEIPGTEEGDTFTRKLELKEKGIHLLQLAGIGTGGASIVLNQGYVDDEDYWNEIIYTGHGGRDEKTGRQIKDQTFTKYNLDLAKNFEEGIPIRVCRGPKLDSPYAPSGYYRYDGLYIIDECWEEKGKDKFIICRFRLRKANDSDKPTSGKRKPKQGKRKTTTVSRLIRDSKESQWVKKLYDYQCQSCGITLETLFSKYAEGAHIHPLGRPHNGPDTRENILCFCPNCHVLFDKHALTILDDFTIKETDTKLHVNPIHKIGLAYLKYKRRISPKI
jgi:putative restriction endonuclease